MLSFFSTPTVDLLEIRENQVVLISNKMLRVGRDTSVRLSLTAPEGKSRVVSSRVFVHQARPVEGGKTAYIATLQTELPFQPVTRETPDSAPLRRGERMDCSLRVMSPDLTDFAGVAVDFSVTGLQIETRNATTLGQVIQIRLETHIEGMEWIKLNARVAWCRREGQKSFRSGLEFRDLTDESRQQLEALARFFRLRETANLTQLVLECSDRYLLGSLETEADEVASN